MCIADNDQVIEDAIQSARRLMSTDPKGATAELSRLAGVYRAAGNSVAALEARRYQCFCHIVNLEVEEAERVALVFLKEATEAGVPRYIGLAQMYLGIVALETGEMGIACEFLEEALQTAQEADDHDLIARVQMNLGNAFFNFERYEDAIKSFTSGLESLEAGSGVSSVALGEYNVASAYAMQSHFANQNGEDYIPLVVQARLHLRRSREHMDADDLSTALLCDLAEAQLNSLEHGHFSEVEFASFARRAEELGVESTIVAVYETRCFIAETLRDWDDLFSSARRAIHRVRANGGVKTIDRLLILAAKGAAEIGEYQHAYEYLQEALDLTRSTAQRQEGRRAHLLDAKLDVQKAKFDQQMLRMRNQFLVERNRELEAEAKTDRLSGVLNRRGVEEALHSFAEKSPGQFSIALVDIDFFKKVNDTFGHAIGDQVIRTFAGILKSSIREPLAVGRWGGEEFMILLEAVSPEDVREAAEGIVEEIRSFDWSVIAEGLLVTTSLGVAVHDPRQHFDESVKTADAFLYAAKQAGRDCWIFRPQRKAA